ncbi:MAG: tetratricopeptide repeat protein, partial [Gemmataceae bacterium]|nr:tetratricopeptide repeat protein [Gemmataceae bacterium]
MDHAGAAPSRSPFAGWLAACAVLLVLALVGWRFFLPATPRVVDIPPPPDPRLSYDGPFRNIHPEVRYAGSAACADCHPKHAEGFAQHPMGRSLFPMSEALASQPPSKGVSFGALGRRFWVTHEGGKVFHHTGVFDGDKPVFDHALEARWAVGSGTHGYSYLTETDGFVLQTGISYFTLKDLWSLSPGFGEAIADGRPVPAGCLQCHADGLAPLPGYRDRFEPRVFTGHAIGCERCHGPGEKHVAERTRGDPVEEKHDTATVNPRRLPPALRDGVCMQCHLQGKGRVLREGRELFDYRPGLPYERFFNVFIELDAGQVGKTVGHFEEMRLSRCAERSEGRLGCISCHDPHYKPGPAERVAFFRARCLKCHQEKGCSEPVAERTRKAPGDSCIQCHMVPREAKDVVHAALTDHRIPRRPGMPAPPAGPPAEFPYRSYFADPAKPDDPATTRDLVIALADKAETMAQHAPQMGPMLARARDLLDAALPAGSTDQPAWHALGLLRRLTGETDAAHRAYERAIALWPTDDRSLWGLGLLHEGQRRPKEAVEAYLRLAKAYPARALIRGRLSMLLAELGRHEEALEHALALKRLSPAR